MFGKLAPALRHGLSALFAPAEDPRRPTSQLPMDGAPLARVRAALTTVTRTRERLAHTAAQLEAIRDQAAEQLVRAEGAGDAETVRVLRAQCQTLEEDGAALAAQLSAVTLEEQRLQLAERRLLAQLETVRARREMAAARYSAAAAEVQAGEALAGLLDGLNGLHADLEHAEAEAEAMQARAAAVRSLLR